jgi:hypothetical protein
MYDGKINWLQYFGGGIMYAHGSAVTAVCGHYLQAPQAQMRIRRSINRRMKKNPPGRNSARSPTRRNNSTREFAALEHPQRLSCLPYDIDKTSLFMLL